MKVHIVHAHSEENSFVSAMRDVMIERFEKRGAEVTLSNLYEMRFNPVLSPEDFAQRRDNDHLVYPLEQRHSFEHGGLASDIVAEIEQVRAADVLAFTFPVYWFSVPAILKGWFDRVFISGTFYGGRRVYGRGGMAGKRALAAFSLGGRPHMFGPGAIHGDLESGMLRHFLRGTLGYVGFSVLEPFVAYHVPYLDKAERVSLLRMLADHVDRLDELAPLPVPDLADFDDSFAPRRLAD